MAVMCTAHSWTTPTGSSARMLQRVVSSNQLEQEQEQRVGEEQQRQAVEPVPAQVPQQQQQALQQPLHLLHLLLRPLLLPLVRQQPLRRPQHQQHLQVVVLVALVATRTSSLPTCHLPLATALACNCQPTWVAQQPRLAMVATVATHRHLAHLAPAREAVAPCVMHAMHRATTPTCTPP